MKSNRKNHIGNIAALVLAFAAILLVAFVARGLVPTGISETVETETAVMAIQAGII